MTAKQRGVVKRWVNALRSGKYKQGKGELKTEGKFCCLGVLCELVVKAKVISDYSGDTLSDVPNVREWAGLADNDGDYGTESLVELNDYKNYSFKKIAKVIESKPDGLFV